MFKAALLACLGGEHSLIFAITTINPGQQRSLTDYPGDQNRDWKKAPSRIPSMIFLSPNIIKA